MIAPAKLDFSAKYSEYGICGALGLFDQGVTEVSDMAWMWNWRKGFRREAGRGGSWVKRPLGLEKRAGKG